MHTPQTSSALDTLRTGDTASAADSAGYLTRKP